MLLYTNESANIQVTYEDLWERVNKTNSIEQYVYTKNVNDVIFHIAYAIINKLDLVLLDGDFTEIELLNLGVSKDELEKQTVIKNPNVVRNCKEFFGFASENLDVVHFGIYTSGTTGMPKRFDHTLRSLLRNIKISDKHEEDVWAFAYNVTHFAGIQVLLQALMNGNHMVDVFGNNARNVDNLMQKYNCKCISATTTYYRNFVLLNSNPNNMIRSVTFGGEKFDDNLIQRIKCKFPNAKLRNVYASTEVGSLLSGNSEAFFIPKLLKNMIVISEDNHLMLHKSLVLHKAIETDWYDTGDIVELNDDGSFKILSRDSDFINVGGYKVNPLEIEQIILNVQGVADVVVYGRENSVTGKLLVADIVILPEHNATDVKKKVFVEVKQNLQPFKCPRIIKVVDNINKSRTGKKVR